MDPDRPGFRPGQPESDPGRHRRVLAHRRVPAGELAGRVRRQPPRPRVAESLGLVTPAEEPVVRRVLSAAAMTYVAATLTSVLTLVYYLFRAGVFGSHDRE